MQRKSVSTRKPTHRRLVAFDTTVGWYCSIDIDGTSESLRLCGGRAAYRVMKNRIPEEAERGEFFTVKLWDGSGNPCVGKVGRQLTLGAGQVADAIPSPTGNASLTFATTNARSPSQLTAVYTCRTFLQNGQKWPRRKRILLGPQIHVQYFGWMDARTIWVTVVSGSTFVSYSIDAGTLETELVEPAVCMPRCTPASAYISETPTMYPSLWTGDQLLPIIQPSWTRTFSCERVEYNADDGQKIYAALYFTEESSSTSPVIVHVHGGPAIAMPTLRRDGADATRYPYRHLLAAGYRVLTPSFRGTMGFGDAFAKGNIKMQGIVDLADCIRGVDHLKALGKLKEDVPIGIFGGSYGGYMTLRATSVHARMFACAVSMWPFVANRWMTYEGGDKTWEDEYIGDCTVWPLTEEAQKHDVFRQLADIKTPTLFIHGEDDDICPVSNSFVAHRILEARGVPTSLCVYPKEGHGLNDPTNCTDRDTRVVAWFNKYMPAKKTI